MKLWEAERGKCAIVQSIFADSALKNRLNGLGVEEGETVVVIKNAPFSAGILVMTATGFVVLRANLARQIEVAYV